MFVFVNQTGNCVANASPPPAPSYKSNTSRPHTPNNRTRTISGEQVHAQSPRKWVVRAYSMDDWHTMYGVCSQQGFCNWTFVRRWRNCGETHIHLVIRTHAFWVFSRYERFLKFNFFNCLCVPHHPKKRQRALNQKTQNLSKATRYAPSSPHNSNIIKTHVRALLKISTTIKTKIYT